MTFRPMHDVEFSADEDVLLLREAVRLKPFMESTRASDPVWSRISTTLSASKGFRHKFGLIKSPVGLMRYRYRYLTDMRREEQARGGSQRHVSAAHREREDLLDTCLALEKDKPTYHFSIRDHILILRAAVSVFSRRGRSTSQENWDAVAKEMRSQPLFSKPSVNGKGVQRVVDGLIKKLRRRGASNGAPADADYQERAELLERYIEIVRGQSTAHSATKVTQRQPKVDAASKLTIREPKTDFTSVSAEQVASTRPKRLTRRPQRLLEEDDARVVDSRETSDSESEFVVSDNDESESDWSEQQRSRNKREVEDEHGVDPTSKKQKIEDDPDAVEMIRLRLEADARRREHEQRVAEQRAMQMQWQQELAERRASLEQSRQERSKADRDVQVQVAKAVAEGISTGIAAIMSLLKGHAALRRGSNQSTTLQRPNM